MTVKWLSSNIIPNSQRMDMVRLLGYSEEQEQAFTEYQFSVKLWYRSFDGYKSSARCSSNFKLRMEDVHIGKYSKQLILFQRSRFMKQVKFCREKKQTDEVSQAECQ